MKDIGQIKMIGHALSQEKENFMRELGRINSNLDSKRATLQKFIGYMQDYSEGENFSASRSIPSLNKNLDSFAKRIREIIISEEKEIERLLKLKEQQISRIEELEQKIRAMSLFEERAVTDKRQTQEKTEQAGMDDLTSTRHSRGKHD